MNSDDERESNNGSDDDDLQDEPLMEGGGLEMFAGCFPNVGLAKQAVDEFVARGNDAQKVDKQLKAARAVLRSKKSTKADREAATEQVTAGTAELASKVKEAQEPLMLLIVSLSRALDMPLLPALLRAGEAERRDAVTAAKFATALGIAVKYLPDIGAASTRNGTTVSITPHGDVGSACYLKLQNMTTARSVIIAIADAANERINSLHAGCCASCLQLVTDAAGESKKKFKLQQHVIDPCNQFQLKVARCVNPAFAASRWNIGDPLGTLRSTIKTWSSTKWLASIGAAAVSIRAVAALNELQIAPSLIFGPVTAVQSAKQSACLEVVKRSLAKNEQLPWLGDWKYNGGKVVVTFIKCCGAACSSGTPKQCQKASQRSIGELLPQSDHDFKAEICGIVESTVWHRLRECKVDLDANTVIWLHALRLCHGFEFRTMTLRAEKDQKTTTIINSPHNNRCRADIPDEDGVRRARDGEQEEQSDGDNGLESLSVVCTKYDWIFVLIDAFDTADGMAATTHRRHATAIDTIACLRSVCNFAFNTIVAKGCHQITLVCRACNKNVTYLFCLRPVSHKNRNYIYEVKLDALLDMLREYVQHLLEPGRCKMQQKPTVQQQEVARSKDKVLDFLGSNLMPMLCYNVERPQQRPIIVSAFQLTLFLKANNPALAKLVEFRHSLQSDRAQCYCREYSPISKCATAAAGKQCARYGMFVDKGYQQIARQGTDVPYLYNNGKMVLIVESLFQPVIDHLKQHTNQSPEFVALLKAAEDVHMRLVADQKVQKKDKVHLGRVN